MLVAIMVFFAIFIVLLAIYVMRKFKHEIIIKRLVGKSKLTTRKKIKMVENTNQTIDFYLMNGSKLPRPQTDAIELMENGGYRLNAYFDGNQYYYIRDTTEFASLPKYEPFDENQRTFMILQEAKAREEQGTNWTQYVPAIAGAMVLIILSFMAYMTYENWNETAVQLNAQNVQISENNIRIMDIVERMDNNIQQIGDNIIKGVPD